MFYYFRNLVPLLSLIIIVVVLFISFSDIFSDLLSFLPNWIYTLIISLISVIIVITLYLSVNFWMKEYSLPKSYYVAIVGFPKSGKTTLITCLFDEAFKGNLPIKFTPRGEQTIEYVNKNISLLEQGFAVGPTADQDRFSFRTDIIVRKFPPQIYRTEFGDFPGGDSKKFIEEYGTWLHKTEFFKWVIDADAIIFVIDLAEYLSSEQHRISYVSKMKTSIRAAWQHYKDLNEHRRNRIRRNPVILAFTKSDLLTIDANKYSALSYENKISSLGSGNKVPKLSEIDPGRLTSGVHNVTTDFNDLISYLTNEVNSMHVIFCSCFNMFNGKRQGLSELIKSIFYK